MQMYERGEIDMTRVGIYDIDRARDPANALNADLREGTALCTYYLGFNVTQPPFDDPKVRQALAMVMEVDKQLGSYLQGPVQARCGLRPSGNVRPQRVAGSHTLRPGNRNQAASRVRLRRC